MARARNWDGLSPRYREQLIKAGITKAAYEAGADLRAARRHLYSPEHPGRTIPGVLAEQFAEELAEGDTIPHTYEPTKTTWPGNGWNHRRTTSAGYDRDRQILEVEFYTNGAIYRYYNVTQNEAQAFRRTRSPGQYIDAVLNSHPYERIN